MTGKAFNFLCVAEKGGKIVCLEEATCRNQMNVFRIVHESKGRTVCFYKMPTYIDVTEQDKNDMIPSNKEREHMSKIICIETLAIYDSIHSCAKKIGVGWARMKSAVSKGRQIFGYHYQYYDDFKKEKLRKTICSKKEFF